MTRIRMALIIALLAGVLWTPLAVAAEGPVDAAAYRQMRADAAQRERRMIFDNDGNEPVYYMDEATPEALLKKRTSALAGTQVDTIMYCTWSSGFGMFTHHTKVGEMFTPTEPEGFANNKTAALFEKGIDPLTVMVDWCKEQNIEVFWTMRMNDIHDGYQAWYSPALFPKWKTDHPEYLLGSLENKPKRGYWSAVAYNEQAVRDRAFAFIEEVCQNYDVDGVNLDFFRHLNYFRSVAAGGVATQEELDMMTDLIRRVRAMADVEGMKRGRPILLSVRVPDSVEYAKAIGLDVERWLDEGLVDLMAVSCYFRLNPWSTSVALGKKFDVPVYAALSETRMKDEEAKRLRASVESYRGRAMNAWRQGVSGIYMFNFFNPDSPLWNELGDPDTLRALEKVYTTGARGVSSANSWLEDGLRFLGRDPVSPERTRKLAPGEAVSVALPVGEDLAGRQATATLELRIPGIAGPEAVSVTLNGEALSGGAYAERWLTFELAPEQVKAGESPVAVTLAADAAEPVTWEDLVLRVKPVRSDLPPQ